MERSSRITTARLAALLALTGCVYVVEVGVVHGVGAHLPARWLTAAVMFDLALVVPLVWWLVALRGAGVRRLLPLVLASLAGSALVVPDGARALVSLARLALVPLELVVLFATVRAVVRAMRAAPSGADVAERTDEALTKAIGDHPVAHVLAAEWSAIAFALLGARASRRGAGTAASTFTLDAARLPAFTWGLVFVTSVETFATHLLLGAAHPRIAWGATALGAYAILWLVGQDRALAARVVSVEADHLVLRAGLRLTARIPWSLVEDAEPVSSAPFPPSAIGSLDVARPAESNMVIHLGDAVPVVCAFGLRRRVRTIAMCIDDPEGLARSVRARSPRLCTMMA